MKNVRSPNPFRIPCSVLAIGLLLGGDVLGKEKPKPNRWNRTIEAFVLEDEENPPAKDGILFVGSSSIRLWDLARSFPGLPVLNRGFGGSEIADSTHFADRIVVPYRPKVIVLYAGDNDIDRGKSPDHVARDFKAFVAKIRTELPKTRIIFICIKPSVARWKLVDQMREANRQIREFAAKDELLEYVDIDRPMLGPDGRPRQGLFLADGLHLNDDGYTVWASALMPHLQAAKNAEPAGR